VPTGLTLSPRHLIPGILLSLAFNACRTGPQPNPSGTFEAVSVAVSTTLAGRLLEVRPREGDIVQIGDTLAVLDIELLRLERDQAAAGYAAIEAQVRVIREGLARAERALTFIEDELARATALLESGSVRQQQTLELTARRDGARHEVDQVRRQIEVLHAERARLDATLKVLDRRIRDGVVLSPTEGQVVVRSAEPGEVVAPGRTILTLADLQTMELRIFLDANDLPKVKVGNAISILPDEHPGDTLRGQIEWISPEAEFSPKNAQTRDARAQLVFAVKIRVPNSDGRIRIGMPAEAMIGYKQ